MAKYYDIRLYIAPRTTVYILGGLAKSLEVLQNSHYENQNSDAIQDVKILIGEILEQLERKGIEVTKKRGQFERYCKIIEYKSKK